MVHFSLHHAKCSCRTVWESGDCFSSVVSPSSLYHSVSRWLEVSLLSLADFLPGFFSRTTVIHFVSRIFCVIENHYVHTARNFSLSGLKLTNLGEFLHFPGKIAWNKNLRNFNLQHTYKVCKWKKLQTYAWVMDRYQKNLYLKLSYERFYYGNNVNFHAFFVNVSENCSVFPNFFFFLQC